MKAKSELQIAYHHAPKKIRFGRLLLLIGSVFFFIASFLNLLIFILLVSVPDARAYVNLSDPNEAFQTIAMPILAIGFLLAGIGGFSYVYDKGPFKSVAPLASAILLVTVVIDTIAGIRTLTNTLITGTQSAGSAWAEFGIGLLDVQISGGIYLLGWALTRDFVGD